MSEIAKARLAALYRYPVKGLSPEELSEAHLMEGAHFPGDRMMAIENGPSGFNPAAPEHMPKQKFLMLMRNEKLARIEARFEDATRRLTLKQGGGVVASGVVDDGAGRAASNASSKATWAKKCVAPHACWSHRRDIASWIRVRVFSRSSTGPA